MIQGSNAHLKALETEYLLELREPHCHNKGTDADPVEVRNVVVVHSDNQPRGFWKLAKIKRTIAGQEGKMRAAAVQEASSQGQLTMLHHPIQCLYQLEINFRQRLPIIPDPGDNSGNSDNTAIRRSKRAAANEARDRILAQSLSLDEN